MSTIAPAWFPDPTHRYEFRYWDGQRWSDDVSRGGIQFVDPLITSADQKPNSQLSDSIATNNRQTNEVPLNSEQLIFAHFAGNYEETVGFPVTSKDGDLLGIIQYDNFSRLQVLIRSHYQKEQNVQLLDLDLNVILKIHKHKSMGLATADVYDSNDNIIGQYKQKMAVGPRKFFISDRYTKLADFKINVSLTSGEFFDSTSRQVATFKKVSVKHDKDLDTGDMLTFTDHVDPNLRLLVLAAPAIIQIAIPPM